MANYIYKDGDLMHYGVPGMKWGVRKKVDYSKRLLRGHSGPGVYLGKKRQLAGDKRDLEGLNNGQHLSVGLSKKRQVAFDAKDRAALERRIAKYDSKVRDIGNGRTTNVGRGIVKHLLSR